MTPEAVGAVLVLAVAFCVGGLSGLAVAWSQPARMQRWAALVERAQLRLNELELKGIGDRDVDS